MPLRLELPPQVWCHGSQSSDTGMRCSSSGSQSYSCSRWTNWASSRNYYYEGGLVSAGTDHYAMPPKALGSI